MFDRQDICVGGAELPSGTSNYLSDDGFKEQGSDFSTLISNFQYHTATCR